MLALDGVGSAGAGEWVEWSGRVFHLRRRLTPDEQALVGEAIDIRGTDEARARRERVEHLLPPGTPPNI